MTNKIPTSESQFVGVWLSRQTNSFLSLYALSKSESKSKVIRSAIERYVIEKGNSSSIPDLIASLIIKYQRDWGVKKRLFNITEDRFTIYKEDLAIKLERKGLEASHIKQILEELTQ